MTSSRRQLKRIQLWAICIREKASLLLYLSLTAREMVSSTRSDPVSFRFEPPSITGSQSQQETRPEEAIIKNLGSFLSRSPQANTIIIIITKERERFFSSVPNLTWHTDPIMDGGLICFHSQSYFVVVVMLLLVYYLVFTCISVHISTSLCLSVFFFW